MKRISLFLIVGFILVLSGCSGAVSEESHLGDSQLDSNPGINAMDEGISSTEESVDSQFLSEEQKEEQRATDTETAITVFNSCRSSDYQALSDIVYFDSLTSQENSLAVTEMDRECVYWYSDGNNREIWHKLSMTSNVSTAKDYVSYLEAYLQNYDLQLHSADQYEYCINVFDDRDLFITLSSYDDFLWIGMKNSKNNKSEIFNILQGVTYNCE